jgi:hypothetical protein
MARLNKSALIERAVEAITADGWTVSRLTGSNIHPARFTMQRDGVLHTVRLYIWNLSHGGKSRSESEFRIQVTGIDGFEPEPNGRTFILGWSEDFGVFAGFDVRYRTGAFGTSPSIQITASTLNGAASLGAAKQSKGHGEWAVAVRPDKLGMYIQHSAAAHRGDLAPILAENDDPAADPLASEISRLADDSEAFDFDVPGEPELRADIVAAVDDVLAALGSPDKEPPPMGHNNPPGPIEEPVPLGYQIEAAGERLKSELGSDKPDARAVGRAGAFLAWAGKLLAAAKGEGEKALEKGKDMAREHMAKALWGAASTMGITFKDEIVGMLRHLGETILTWLQHISVF